MALHCSVTLRKSQSIPSRSLYFLLFFSVVSVPLARGKTTQNGACWQVPIGPFRQAGIVRRFWSRRRESAGLTRRAIGMNWWLARTVRVGKDLLLCAPLVSHRLNPIGMLKKSGEHNAGRVNDFVDVVDNLCIIPAKCSSS
jgi:hypothetical protein